MDSRKTITFLNTEVLYIFICPRGKYQRIQFKLFTGPGTNVSSLNDSLAQVF